MIINLKNFEQIIFFDKNIVNLFPEFRHYFDQWRLAHMIPGMKSLAQRSILDLFNSLENHHRIKLQEYFNETVIFDKINDNLTENVEGDIYLIETDLCTYTGFHEFCATRNKNQISITFWR